MLTDNDKRPVSGTFQDATPLLETPDLIRERAELDGMIFFRGLLPRETVMAVRGDVLGVLRSYELLEAGREDEAIGDGARIRRYTAEEVAWNGVGAPLDVYRDIQKLESFHALAHAPAIRRMLTAVFGGEPFVHPRNIARVMLPHPDVRTTPSHQDFLHVQGSSDTWTCWIPLGDVPRALGGLAVLKGSHREGLLGVTHAAGAGGLESILCGLDYEWETVDFEAGDVLAFHSHTVHKALPNLRPGTIRLSCDFRYQRASDPIEAASLRPHGPYEWEELYEGWTRRELMYYWKESAFEYVPFDQSIRWQQEKIC
ncbi:phytanoyl-CoA dioxygenase family protein [Paenibacillus antri]|uniref:Phytanoyl-CoA dioxygenase family protein n=1 Tax=Paenibacillus antri TaxID=2582848 RepID=A0A5R9GJY7_9BACL|nr:phytanoyl-CoA dioxygenase family protein [Paenibacillus antri]TLS53243.1 phytanoyl-CoA dioxygenase family protein [Paenibacillus antri]